MLCKSISHRCRVKEDMKKGGDTPSARWNRVEPLGLECEAIEAVALPPEERRV